MQVLLMSLAQIALIYALASEAPVRAAVQPPLLMKGGAVRVTCTVPRHPDNRRLDVMLPGYTESSRTLDGEDSRVTWEFVFTHIPCEVETAVCRVVRITGAANARAPISVQGCDDGN